MQASLEARLFGESTPVRIGRFEILERIGRGGMGVVFRARDPALDRVVAVKVIAAPRSLVRSGAASTKRLRREARALARFAHPNLVAVLDVGTADGQTYIAMEYVGGGTLADWCKRNPIGTSGRDTRVLELFEQAARGLAAAHKLGVIHRDIKPTNMLLDAGGRLRLADFGLARMGGVDPSRDAEPSPSVTDVESQIGIAGTPAYMAPEQFDGESNEIADQYSLCVSFYQVASGKLPPRRGAEHSGEPAASEDGGFDPTVPRRLALLLKRGMATRPDDRFPSIDALLDALVRLRRSPRRTLVVGGIAVGAIAMAIAAGSVPTGPACEGGSDALAAAWTPALREQLRVSLPDDPERFDALETRLDTYALDWERGYRAACATDAAELDERMACLKRSYTAFGAFSVRLVEAPGPKTAAAAAELPELELCQDMDALERAAPVTRDPGVLAEIADVRQAFHTLKIEDYSRPLSELTARGVELYERAEATDHPPLIRDVARLAANQLLRAGDRRAVTVLERAVAAVDRPGSEHLAVDLAGVIFELVDVGAIDVADAQRYLRRAETLWERIDDEELRNSAWLDLSFAQAVALHDTGQIEAAVAKLEGLVPAFEESSTPQELANLLKLLGNAERKLSRYESAKIHLDRALTMMRSLQFDGMDIISLETLLFGIALETGAADEAVRYAQGVLTYAAANLPSGSPLLGVAHANLGSALSLAGQRQRAAEETRRALTICKATFPPGHVDHVTYRVNLAQFLDDTAEKEALLREAVDIGLEQHGADSFPYGNALSASAAAALQHHDYAAAFDRSSESLRIFERSGRRRRAAVARLEAARALLGLRRLNDADELATAALAEAEEIFGTNNPKLADYLLGSAEVDLAQGDADSAAAALERARRLAAEARGEAKVLARVEELLR